jgi:hypothetical protein
MLMVMLLLLLCGLLVAVSPYRVQWGVEWPQLRYSQQRKNMRPRVVMRMHARRCGGACEQYVARQPMRMTSRRPHTTLRQ